MEHIETIYGQIDSQIYSSLKHIKLLVCDVDGVFSDGRIYLGNNNEEYKAFHTRDGFGIKAIVNLGIDVAVVTGRQSAIVERRMNALNVRYILQGREDKATALQELLAESGHSRNAVAAVGDDVPDIGLFEHAILPIAVADAHPLVRQRAKWITSHRGGFGAIREICDLLLDANGALDNFSGASI